MGYAEGNTHGYAKEDMSMETVYIRLLDTGEFNNSEEIIDYLQDNNYKVDVYHLSPFVEFEVSVDNCYDIMRALRDHCIDFRIF